MVKRKTVLFYSGVVLWGLFVAAMVVYLFFPYQRALKIALQNAAGASGMNISMEGVSLRTMGVKASKLLVRPSGSTGKDPGFEFSNVDISWNPLSLIHGRLTVHSRASAYDGTVTSTVDGIPLTGTSNPNLSLKAENIDLAKYPPGAFTSVKGVTGILNGWLKKETSAAKPDRQTGSFRVVAKAGEIKELQVKDMPRLIIPYKEIAIEGKIDGPRLDITRLSLDSDLISLKGTGFIGTGEFDHTLDIKLTYEARSAGSPFKGKGAITVRGTRNAPIVTVTEGKQ